MLRILNDLYTLILIDINDRLLGKCNRSINLKNIKDAALTFDQKSARYCHNQDAEWNDHINTDVITQNKYRVERKIPDPTMYDLGKNSKAVAFKTVRKLIRRFDQFQSPWAVLRKWDANKSGRMSYEETDSMLKGMGYHLNTNQLNEFMNIFQSHEKEYQKMKDEYNKSNLEKYHKLMNKKMAIEPDSISLSIFYQFMMGQIDIDKLTNSQQQSYSSSKNLRVNTNVAEIIQQDIKDAYKLEMIAKFQNLTNDQIADSRMKQTSVFRYLDSNKDGIISKKEFLSQMSKLIQKPENELIFPDDINRIYDMMAEIGGGKVDLKAFATLYSVPIDNSSVCWKLISPHKSRTNRFRNRSVSENDCYKPKRFMFQSNEKNLTSQTLDFNVHADEIDSLLAQRNKARKFGQQFRHSDVFAVDPHSSLYQSERERFCHNKINE